MSQELPPSIWDIKIGLPKANAILEAIANGADENVLCLLGAGADPSAKSLVKTASEVLDRSTHETTAIGNHNGVARSTRTLCR